MDESFHDALRQLDSGDLDGLRASLLRAPQLATMRVEWPGVAYFQHPALLEFVAENPVRNGKLPPNIVEIARIILDAGAKDDAAAVNRTLALVASGRVARECGVQVPLFGLLASYGGDVNAAMLPALAHGEFAAAEALLRSGAKLRLAVAAALGRSSAAAELLPDATAEERHRALALAAQFGHTDIVRMLLDAGEDPNRFNPPGIHAHSTPLHQAAHAGHSEVVRLLLERGARTDLRDTLWDGTPEDWARHAGRQDIAIALSNPHRGTK